MSPRFRFANVLAVWRKELLDIVRDRRTLMSMIVVPILLMPVLMIGVGALMASSFKELEARTYSVGIVHADSFPRAAQAFADEEKLTTVDLGNDEEQARLLVEDGTLEAAVVLAPPAETDSMKLIQRGNREVSQLASRRARRVLEGVKDQLVAQRLADLGETVELLEPFDIAEVNLATEEQMVMSVVATFIPYMLILMSLTGAMYPAIDMTAGEKERGTLETLLASPAARSEIVLGKFGAIATTGIISALLSVASLVVAVSGGGALLGQQFGAEISFSLGVVHILWIVLLLIPIAALFGALLMIISVFAKSTREAQSYISPLMILVIIPAMMSMMPGSQTTLQKAWIPVVNVSTVLKEVLNGELDPATLAITLISTVIYAGVALFLTTRVFQREEVLFRV